MSDPVQDFGFRAITRFWAQAQLAALHAQEDAAKTIARAFSTALENAGQARPDEAIPGAKPGPLVEMPRLAEASKTASELWSAAHDFSETLFAAAVSTAGMSMAIATNSARGVAEPQRVSADAGNPGTLSGLLGQLVDGPQFADMLNGERQHARVFKAWLDLCQHRLAQNFLVLNVWLGAGHRFSSAWAERNKAASAPLDSKAVLALWVETANRDLIDMQRSKPFLDVQRTVMNSGVELKVAQHDMAEGWATRFDLPTRTELDDVHRTVTELKRDMRSLKRQGPARVASNATVVTETMAAPDEIITGSAKTRPPAAAGKVVVLPKKPVKPPSAPAPARRRRMGS